MRRRTFLAGGAAAAAALLIPGRAHAASTYYVSPGIGNHSISSNPNKSLTFTNNTGIVL